MTTISLLCKSCGGTLNVEDGREVLSCPYCGSKELVVESDDVKKERIKYDAYRDVAVEELHNKREMENDRTKNDLKTFIGFVLVFVGLAVGCILCFSLLKLAQSLS